MQRQLALIDESPDWRLDERTRALGREGVAKAREALRQARQRVRERDLAQAATAEQRPSAA